MSKQNSSVNQVDRQSYILGHYFHEKAFDVVSRGQLNYRQPFVFDNARLVDTSTGDSWPGCTALILEIGPDYFGVIEAIRDYLDSQVTVARRVTLRRRQYWLDILAMFEEVQADREAMRCVGL